MSVSKHMAVGLVCGLVLTLTLVALSGQTGALRPNLASAQATLQAGAPGLISYQGYLEDGSGQPFSGSASMRFAIYAASAGGSALWEETQNGVSVGNGFFTVQLGSVTPFSASVFDDPTRYLQVTVNIGAGEQTLPRQRLTAVPYALQSQVAASVPWSGITGVPPGLGANYEHVIVVAQSGGDYTSVAAALASISDSSATNRYLVWVAPGVYTETELALVRPYVHLRGAGANVSVVTSARTGTTPGDAAATARLDDNGRISDIAVRNTGTGIFGIGIWSSAATRAAVVENAVVEAIGTDGTGRYAVYLNDSEPRITDSILRASGATGFGTGVNAALGSVNVSGGFPQPLIEGSMLIGGNADPNGKSCAGNTGTGFGIQYTNTAATVRDSYICGDRRAIFGGINGVTRIEQSKLEVSSTSGSFLIETSGSAAINVATSGVFFVGNKLAPSSNASSLTCTQSYKANYTDANAACE